MREKLRAVLLTVVVIAGSVMAALAFIYMPRDESDSPWLGGQYPIAALERAIAEFRLDHGQYPWHPDAVGQLVSADIVRELLPDDPRLTVGRPHRYNKRGRCYLSSLPDKCVKDGKLVDLWGNEYGFRWNSAEGTLLIYSVGADGIDQTADGNHDYGDDIINL